jgi:hypothetical protein
MKNFKIVSFLVVQIFLIFTIQAQNIGTSATGAVPNAKAMLDIVSTTSGLLIPRMTTAQRDAITTPPNGLQVYNTTTNTLDSYRNSAWSAVSYTNALDNMVRVFSLADLPTPAAGAITLDASKVYVFSGLVNITPNYINMNGAGLEGIDPAKDGVMSSVSGAILRSSGVSVYMQNFAVIPLSGSTKAYDFADATGTKFCNLFSGCSVVEVGIPSLGVGQVSGFKAVTIEKNYWNCKDGIKVTGTIGKFASILNQITDITAGSGIEFLSGLNVKDIDLSNNYFTYTGQTGVKLNAGAVVERGRMTTNMFRGVTTPITGFNSFSFGWEMQQNTDIPNSYAYGYMYMNDNATATTFASTGTYYKVLGTTTATKEIRFTGASNRFTYTGKNDIVSRIFASIAANAPSNSSGYSIAIAKNGTVITAPSGSISSLTNNQGFQISFESNINMVTGDYLEIFIKSNNTSNLTISDLQFRIEN